MTRKKLFSKYYKNPNHDYEIVETISATDDTGRTPDVCFVYAGRNRGKSFEIASQCIADAWYDKKQFAYVRRNDATTYDVEQYFADKIDFIRDMTDGARDGITRDRGKLKFYKDEIQDDGEVKRVKYEECGQFFALSRQSSYKSLQYPNIYNIIYEEVLTDGVYLGAEPEKLMNLYSTLRRNKTGFRMWLISNLDSVVNPYSRAWAINLAHTKAGEIKLSKLYLGSADKNGNEEYILIASHYLADKNTITKEEEKKKRNRIRTAISNNKWDEKRLYTTIDKSFIEPYKPIASCVFEWDDVMMLVEIINKPCNLMDMYLDGASPANRKMPIAYVQRKTTPPQQNTRIYTNNPERFGQFVTRGYKNLCKIDEVMEMLRKNGWIIGADNLTMNDFMNIWGKLRNPMNI